MPAERSRVRIWAGRLGIALGALLVVGAAGEIMLRLAPDVGGTQSILGAQLGTEQWHYIPDPELGALVAPFGHDTVRTPAYTYLQETDHAGFTNPEPWPSRVDIAVLGNSLLEGPGVGQEGQFTTVLEHDLGDRSVLNLGLPGGGTAQELRVYQRFAKALHPKVVIAALWVIWDIDNSEEFAAWLRENRPDPDFTHYRYTFGSTHQSHDEASSSEDGRILNWLRGKLSESYLLRAVYGGLRSLLDRQTIPEQFTFPNGEDVLLSVKDQLRLTKGFDRPGTPDILETFFHPLEQLKSEVEADGGRFLIVLVPSKEEIYAAKKFPAVLTSIREVRAGLAAKGLPVLDLYPVFREHGREHSPFYRTDMHLNELGNKLLAESVAQWIDDQHLFPPPTTTAVAPAK